ncbi:reticulocyte binding protein 2 homolog a [Aquipluma nitroreducens]|uniref:Reticulocyte binding protein 2 homolog a n=1 Tax=Aquipluma nitroreducens TaxID=2010828 RepID=A0A5K7SFT5_9BACT|nr:hypothetical protein [Aquipluma nitroreducens]BBE20451.1 reticulocyte binding protein 2 homolog a [Aquipluma nitroreducens]
MKELKGDSEIEYLQQTRDDFFLDVNVIDFGKTSIRNTYVNNLKENEYDLMNYLGGSLEEDIEIIEKIYEYEDFFAINIDRFIYLEHQQNKLISRYGLHYFTHIIKENYSGFIKTSSFNEGVYLYRKTDKSTVKIGFDNFIKYGTVYNCIIPLNRGNEGYILSVEPPTLPSKETPSFNTFLMLDKYKIVNYKEVLSETKNYKYIYRYSETYEQSSSIQRKYERIKMLFKEFSALPTFLHNSIFLLDATHLKLAGESEWVRLLASISLYFSDLIVFNIDVDVVRKIIDLRRSTSHNPLLKFWNNENRVLFYSYKYNNEDHNRSYKRYGATLLSGETEKDFDLINKNIWRHHYSFRNGILKNIEDSDNANTNYITHESKLFNEGKLMYFELLLKNEDPWKGVLSLFEESVQYSLNKRFDVLGNSETNNKGYKIANTHFRLGSKIHIRDFYYAKRMFQNSFFTIPLSYLLSNIIYDLIKGKDEITIIGYEDYSNFLTSSTRNMLEKKIKESKLKITVNHNTIDKDGKLSKDVASIKRNIVIIVPIVSSFSTSVKINNQLVEIFESNNLYRHKNNFTIIPPTLNVILVGHKSLTTECHETFEEIASKDIESIKEGDTIELYNIYKDELLKGGYNWHSIDKTNKVVRVETFNADNQLIKQKYFIPVYTEWNNADNCALCYSPDITNEKCLIETGKASISPTLIFGYPRTKSPNKFGRQILNLKQSLLYGNLTRGNSKYLYFTPTGRIVKNNDEQIIIWLKTLKDTVFNSELLQYKKVVLVSPVTGSKSNFIDLVNEYVFEYTANCLSISLEEDYIENAESLYADGLHQADIVIFVDDVLATVNSFLETNYIVKFIRNKINTDKGIDYCIALINRMSFDCEDNLLLKLPKGILPFVKQEDRLYYYTKINNPSIEEPNNEFPLTKEMKRYQYLASTSSLDSTKVLFLNKINKLKPVNIGYNVPNNIKDYIIHNNKKLFQLLVLNQFYRLFEIEQVITTVNGNTKYIYEYDIDNYFKKDTKALIRLEKKILKELASDIVHQDIIEKYSHNLKYIILKITCSTPLIYYQEIRDSSFHWIIGELEVLREEINKLNSENINSLFSVNTDSYFSKFQKLKFLLKRSVQLKSNYIIHPEFFKSFKKIINLIYAEKENLEKTCSNNNKSIIKELIRLYDSTKYIPGKVLVYDYILELKHLISNKEFDNYTDNISYSSLKEESKKYIKPSLYEDYDENKSQFDKRFSELKQLDKFGYISPKKLIYQMIALIQELINDHETKAIKLEKNIKIFDYDPNDNGNGNFNHYLRLLKLENTAIIERFWEYFKIRETANNLKPIEIKKFSKTLCKYENDPKYIVIIKELEAECKDSFDKFIELQSRLINWSRREIINKDDIKSQVKIILSFITNIVGPEAELALLTVNYSNLIEPDETQLYTFESFKRKKKKDQLPLLLNSKEKLKKSLTAKMFNVKVDNNDDEFLSNLEILKNQSGIQIRKDIFESSIVEGFSEIIELSSRKEYSLLAIRITDLTSSEAQYLDPLLYTQAVLTIVLNKGKRLDENKLRLLLLLRKLLSDFIKTEISNNTFLELLNTKARDEYQSDLKHGLREHLTNLGDILEDIKESILERIIASGTPLDDQLRKEIINEKSSFEEIFDLIRQIISGQIGAYDLSKDDTKIKEVSFIDFKKFIKLLFESKYIGLSGPIFINDDDIKFLDSPYIQIPEIIFNIVIPELVINIKNHSLPEDRNIRIEFEDNKLSFRNRVDINDRGTKNGLNMCKKIFNGLSNFVSLLDPIIDEDNNFIIIIKIEDNDANEYNDFGE